MYLKIHLLFIDIYYHFDLATSADRGEVAYLRCINLLPFMMYWLYWQRLGCQELPYILHRQQPHRQNRRLWTRKRHLSKRLLQEGRRRTPPRPMDVPGVSHRWNIHNSVRCLVMNVPKSDQN